MSLLESIVSKIQPLDPKWRSQAQERLDHLTKPQGSLGRLEEIATQIVAITETLSPILSHKVIITIAADHGIASEGVSAYPQAVTAQMVLNFLRGGAGINVLARHIGARVVVVDMGVAGHLPQDPALLSRKINFGTNNFSRTWAMSREEAVRSIETGIEIAEAEFQQGVKLIGTGDMGIANTTAASAITSVLTGAVPEEVTGRGTGIDEKAWLRKVDVIRQAIERNQPNPQDPIDVLAKVGGFEIGGLVGVILAGAAHRIPVVLDGFISGSAALIAYRIQPLVRSYCLAAHQSVEKGHVKILTGMDLQPILDLNLRLGEGTGAALSMGIIEAACKILTEMATFGEAGVAEKSS